VAQLEDDVRKKEEGLERIKRLISIIQAKIDKQKEYNSNKKINNDKLSNENKNEAVC
jgi:hypothetical protein